MRSGKALAFSVFLLAACAAFFYFLPQYGEKLLGHKRIGFPKQVREAPARLKQALPKTTGKAKPGKKGPIQCWQDAHGNMIYTNIAPADKGMKPCR